MADAPAIDLLGRRHAGAVNPDLITLDQGSPCLSGIVPRQPPGTGDGTRLLEHARQLQESWPSASSTRQPNAASATPCSLRAYRAGAAARRTPEAIDIDHRMRFRRVPGRDHGGFPHFALFAFAISVTTHTCRFAVSSAIAIPRPRPAPDQGSRREIHAGKSRHIRATLKAETGLAYADSGSVKHPRRRNMAY